MPERLLQPKAMTPPAPAARPRRTPAWRRVAVGLVIGHLAIAAARVPGDVIGKRCERVAAHRARGPIRYHLDSEFLQGAAAVEWVVRHAAPDSVVLHRGCSSGAIEFVPPLIWPRLLYDEAWVGGDGGVPLHRPVARGPLDGRDATGVLLCDPDRPGRTQRLRVVAR